MPMDELDLIRAARPPDGYPDAQRAATRAAVLTGITGLTQAQAASRPRLAGRWRAGLVATVAALTLSAAMTVVAVHAAERPAHTRPSLPAPGGSAGRVLELAARTTVTAPPPGTRWIVTESQITSTAWQGPECGGTVRAANGQAYGKLIPGPATCPAAPPATMPRFRVARTKAAAGTGPAGYPVGLPDQPGPLLTALYRWLGAAPRAYLPGTMAPRVPAPVRHVEAFDTLVQMITQADSAPGKGVLLAALGQIQGVKVTHIRASADIGVTIGIPGWQDTMIMSAQNYKIIGDRDTSVLPSGQRITVTDIPLWQAYYDASGHRL